MNLFMDVDTALGLEGGDIDDALAIAYLAGEPEAAGLRGISIVAGNVTQPSGVRSTLMICELLNLDAPVLPGSTGPADRPLRTGHSIVMNAPVGVENWIFDRTPQRPPAEVDLVATLRDFSKDETITLLATGPMTNMARLFREYPEVKPRIDRIVTMGGWFIGETRHPEFNMMVDPVSAGEVFKCGIPLTIVPLEMTLQTLLLPEEIEEWKACGPAGKYFHQGTMSWIEKMREVRQEEGCNLHDPLAAVALMHPEIVKTIGIEPVIDCETGRTDVTAENPESAVRLVVDFDRQGFQKILLDSIRRAFKKAMS